MRIDIITIFPNIFDSYIKESLIGRAIKKKLVTLNFHDLRRWADDERGTIDDRPFGGGLGMVLKPEPIIKAVKSIQKDGITSRVIVFTPRGKKFNQKKAQSFSEVDQLIMICGRYEGIDERILKYLADEKISLGNYILMGGELPAILVTEAVTRLVPGVIGKESFISERAISRNKEKEGVMEYPQYTRPEVVDLNKITGEKSKWKVPKDLISGDHKKIELWRKKNSRTIWK